MDNLILLNILILGGAALIAAFVLYFASQKFKIQKDELTGAILSVLPQANCGGCGYTGCAEFAKTCAKADAQEFLDLSCPVGGT